MPFGGWARNRLCAARNSMPSPFPGMDPYLEDRALWKGVHDSLIYRMLEDLQPRLQPHYIAVLEGRLLLQPLEEPSLVEGFRGGRSDLSVHEGPHPGQKQAAAVTIASPGDPEVAVPEWVDEPELRIWHSYLEIRDAQSTAVVTVIELLSPWNKSPGQGQEEYRAKQRALLLSDTNLVEIDLLRGGAHTVAARSGKTPPSDYRICIHRVARPAGFEVIPFGLRDPLPRVGVPLRAGEPDVLLDLPSVMCRVYDTGVYNRLVDYRGGADPPVADADAAWADDLLRERGYR
jgi:hypothetical protein